MESMAMGGRLTFESDWKSGIYNVEKYNFKDKIIGCRLRYREGGVYGKLDGEYLSEEFYNDVCAIIEKKKIYDNTIEHMERAFQIDLLKALRLNYAVGIGQVYDNSYKLRSGNRKLVYEDMKLYAKLIVVTT